MRSRREKVTFEVIAVIHSLRKVDSGCDQQGDGFQKHTPCLADTYSGSNERGNEKSSLIQLGNDE